MFARFYCRKKRPEVIADVLGHRMILDPHECVDGQILFCPHLYGRREIRHLRRYLAIGDSFLDAGANIGFYSLIAAQIVGGTGRVLAVEADPGNFDRLEAHVRLNDAQHIISLSNVGLSDRSETLRLGLNLTGNRGGHSFLRKGSEGVMVQCRSLLDVLGEHRFDRIDVAKFDIEGFEFKVLRAFLEGAPRDLMPRTMLLEQNDEHLRLGAGDALRLLREHGYTVRMIKDRDYLAERVAG